MHVWSWVRVSAGTPRLLPRGMWGRVPAWGVQDPEFPLWFRGLWVECPGVPGAVYT